MPQMLRKPCAYPGCPELVELGQRYCAKHQRQARRQEDERRGSARERGYTSQWEKVRSLKLRRNPLCEVCEREGRVRPAEMVHHAKPIRQGGAALDMDNLMSVCRACHDRLHTGSGKERR